MNDRLRENKETLESFNEIERLQNNLCVGKVVWLLSVIQKIA